MNLAAKINSTAFMFPALTKCISYIWLSVCTYRYRVKLFMLYLYSIKYMLRRKRCHSAFKNG